MAGRRACPPEDVGGPWGKVLDFVEEHDHLSLADRYLVGLCPQALPETRQGGPRAIRHCVEGLIAELVCKIEKQRGLAHLAGSGQKLDPLRRRFGQTLAEQAHATRVIQPEGL
jgi:hypothetical protein